MTPQFHDLTVRSVHADAEDARVVTFDVPSSLRDAYSFVPGQHLTLRATVGGQELRRAYSICSGLDDGDLRVGVRRVAGGVFSNWLHDTLQAGDRIAVLPPDGRFCCAPQAGAARHVLGVAAGSGITPILSILKTLLAREPGSRFTLVYGNRRATTAMFKEEIADLKDRYLTRLQVISCFSREDLDAPMQSGRVDQALLGRLLETLIDARHIAAAYLCGPHDMNEGAQTALIAAGLTADQVHIERFGVPADAVESEPHAERPGDAARASVVIVRDGVHHSLAYELGSGTLLEAATASGLDLPFSCRSGVCATCRAKLIEGDVRMDRNFALEPYDLAAGYVLTCQAHPLSERVVVSFDER